jgi:HAD superfamily hydrolase (TIGR01509 family)
MPDAVIFDLDGVLIDSEQLWNAAKQEVTEEEGGSWLAEEAPVAMMGMSSPEWSAYMREVLHVPMSTEAINRAVVERIEGLYRERLPLLPGAIEAVRSLAGSWPVGLASSSNREIIDLVLEVSGLAPAFTATVSSEEVPFGKPSPDVYVETARRLDVDPGRCVALEDSSNGLRAAAAAGMAVIAVPNQHYPPQQDALALAAATVAVVGDVTPALVRSILKQLP